MTTGKLEAVWCAAYDLKQAIQRVKETTNLPDTELLREINAALRGSGFKIACTEH